MFKPFYDVKPQLSKIPIWGQCSSQGIFGQFVSLHCLESVKKFYLEKIEEKY